MSRSTPREDFSRKRLLALAPLVLGSAAWSAHIIASPVPQGHVVDALAKSAARSTYQRPLDATIGTSARGMSASAGDALTAGAAPAADLSDVPAIALAAYQRAVQIMSAAKPGCGLPWELLAAIGQVESDDGQSSGSTLSAKGVETPSLFGPVLDGKHGTELVKDTDGGRIDHDAHYDRAVGPMQILPSTWRVVAVDADQDGKRNPQDINDAALGAAVYLCAEHGNLGTTSGQRAAVFRYNHSEQYVAQVLRLEQGYAAGDVSTIPAGVVPGVLLAPTRADARHGLHAHARRVETTRLPVRTHAQPSPPKSHGAGKPTPVPTPAPSTPPKPANVVTTLGQAVTGVVRTTGSELTCTVNGLVAGLLGKGKGKSPCPAATASRH